MKKVLMPQVVAIMTSILLGTECKDNGVVPDYLKPGRRDYVWTVDTLVIPSSDYFYPTRIWGSSSHDVWIAGFGSPPLLWHFDGSSWSRITPGGINPSALWGFSYKDIWLGNVGNVFWRYDGVRWYKFSDIVPPTGFNQTVIEGIWGTWPRDVWGVGFADSPVGGGDAYKGIIMKFDGTKWERKPIPDTRVSFADIRLQSSSGYFFIFGTRFERTGDTSKVYRYDGQSNLEEIYSDPYSMNVESMRGEVYFVSRSRIFKFDDNKLTLWKDFSSSNYLGWLKGRSELDFFGIGMNGDIVHYNGTDLATVFPGVPRVFNMFVVDESVFVLCVDLDNDINTVVHGKLRGG